MRHQTLYLFWAATGALLVLVLAVYIGRGVKDYKRMPVFLKNVKNSAQDITAIRLERLAEKIELEKKADGWRLILPEEYAAQENTVTDILSALGAAQIEEKVSSRKDRFSDFELDDARSIRFWAKTAGGKVAAAGRLGKQVAGSWDRSYFSPEDSSEVYIVKGLPRYQLDKLARDFKSRMILQAPKEKIASVVISKDKNRLALTNEGGVWKVNGKSAKEDKVNEILGIFAQLEANDFAEPFEVGGGLKKLGLDKKPKESLIRISLTDGKTYELWIGEKKDTLYFAKLAGQPTVWKLADWKVTPLKVKESDLTAATPQAAAPTNKPKKAN